MDDPTPDKVTELRDAQMRIAFYENLLNSIYGTSQTPSQSHAYQPRASQAYLPRAQFQVPYVPPDLHVAPQARQNLLPPPLWSPPVTLHGPISAHPLMANPSSFPMHSFPYHEPRIAPVDSRLRSFGEPTTPHLGARQLSSPLTMLQHPQIGGGQVQPVRTAEGLMLQYRDPDAAPVEANLIGKEVEQISEYRSADKISSSGSPIPISKLSLHASLVPNTVLQNPAPLRSSPEIGSVIAIPLPQRGGSSESSKSEPMEAQHANAVDGGESEASGTGDIRTPPAGTNAQLQHAIGGSAAQESTRRIRMVKNKWNEVKSRWEEKEIDLKRPDDPVGQSAVCRQNYDSDNKVDFEEVDIYSRNLNTLLAEVSPSWQENADTSQSTTVRSPFFEFVWHWDKYAEACNSVDTDSEDRAFARQDLKEVMHFITNSHTLAPYFRVRESQKRSNKTRFQDLWTLFGHATKVYARSHMSHWQLFEVASCSDLTVHDPRPESRRCRISCRAFDWDGAAFQCYTYDFWIDEFKGERLISSLEVVPSAVFHRECDNDGQIRNELLERGKKHFKICTEEVYQCDYQGPVLVTSTGHPGSNARTYSEWFPRFMPDGGPETEELETISIDITERRSRVIADNYSFLKSARNTTRSSDGPPLAKKVPTKHRRCSCGLCGSSLTLRWTTETHSFEDLCLNFPKDEDHFRLLPPRILGYSLQRKLWGQFLVDKLVPVSGTDPERPFENQLVLDPDSKISLKAYMEHHKAPARHHLRSMKDRAQVKDAKSFDIIEGKGQGLVILLHGSPGVGKTLTAETIALETGRPLLTVSVADIGIEYESAEKRLAAVFVDAARWKAVLLMDEADIFVEERGKNSIERNALVSVMLRCLEYFDGILIMTTNRVKSIDAAVQSRIQLAIHYKDLSSKQRLTLYQKRIERIPLHEIGTEGDRQKLMEEVEKSPLVVARTNNYIPNGRQIRNIVTYARAIAIHEGRLLKIGDLLTVNDTTERFTSSMRDSMSKQRLRNELYYEE